MRDPYQVLGVDRSASDDEIKKAYRSMSRRYHPDANVNNPNRDQAEERFKEVQASYDQIMKERQQGYSSYSYGRAGETGRSGQGPFGGFYGTRGSAGQEQSPLMQAATRYINNGKYEEALNVLNGIPASERRGLWYYYSAVANSKLGNKAKAVEHIQVAVIMEPGNMVYRQFQQQLEYGGRWYTNMGGNYERPYSGYSSYCMSLILMQLLCNCCCRL